MKKVLSVLLLTSLLLSTVIGCSVPTAPSTSVTASAGADKYVEYLEKSLDKMPDSLVVASGADTAAYGVDATDFVDDEGYTIRANEGNVVILGKTDAALYRAVRQFANYGNCYDYSFTYGEEYRVQSLTIAGNDISEFAVIRPDDADECMRYAMDELVKYTRIACGVTLPVYSAGEYAAAKEKPAKTISFIIDYPAHGDEAFTISVKADGNVDVLCGRWRGGLYGVYGLLDDMGWRFFGDGTEYLYESDGLDLTSAINRKEEPAIDNRFASAYPISYDFSVGNRLNFHGRYVNAATMSKYGYYGVVREACHGLREFEGGVNWGGAYGGYNGYSQPCFTDEAILQAIEDHYRNYIETRIAAGAVPGKDLAYIDVSQFDSSPSGFCICGNCMKAIGQDGSSTGPVLQMTNRIADMAAEYSPDIAVLMLAYCGTNKPPRKTVPRDNVKIAYCFYYAEDAVCANHNVYSDECQSEGYTNKPFCKEFEGWKKICPEGSLQVWYYPMNGYEMPLQTPIYDTAFGDMKYFIESGVECMMFCEGDNNDPILLTALSKLIWDGDMTEEEYKSLLEEYFCIYYGMESGKYIYEYANMIVHAGDIKGCWSAFGSPMFEKLDANYIAVNFDYIVHLFDRALKYAETQEIYNRIELLYARMLYMGISAVHEDRYVNGSDEDRALIAELYSEMHGLFIKYRILVSGSDNYAPAEYDVTKSPSEHWFNI